MSATPEHDAHVSDGYCPFVGLADQWCYRERWHYGHHWYGSNGDTTFIEGAIPERHRDKLMENYAEAMAESTIGELVRALNHQPPPPYLYSDLARVQERIMVRELLTKVAEREYADLLDGGDA